MISNFMTEQLKNSSTIRAMFEEGLRLSKIYGSENVYDFSIGNPNLDTPNEIKDIINNILSSEKSIDIHGYMNNSGYESVRNKIAHKINEKDNLNLDYKNIIMTCGAAGALNVLCKTFLDKNDEVIVFAPFFGEYRTIIKNYEGKTIIVETIKDSFQIDFENLSKNINKNTKAVIINSPNNPTGVIYTEESIKKLSRLLEEKQKELDKEIYLISDEPYREIVYDDSVITNVLNHYDNSLIVYSYSKSLSLAGERIGYIVVSSKIKNFNTVTSAINTANRILGFVNAPSLFQKVIGESLDLRVDVDIYRKNRDFIYKSLTDIGFSCIKPEGAFYLFVKTPIEDDVAFCEEAKKHHILLVPGSVFGGSGYFRLSYCVSYEKLVNSINAFKNLFNVYKI